jgi:hypothetical protein
MLVTRLPALIGAERRKTNSYVAGRVRGGAQSNLERSFHTASTWVESLFRRLSKRKVQAPVKISGRELADVVSLSTNEKERSFRENRSS